MRFLFRRPRPWHGLAMCLVPIALASLSPWVSGLATRLVAADPPQLTADRLLDPDHVVDVRITLPPKDWDALRRQTRSLALSLGKTPVDTPFRYFKGDVTIDGVWIRNVGIRKKGFLGSLSETRPSLKIKFGEFEKQHPVAGLDRLTLNNNKQDRALASQYLCYRFFNETGTVACRCNHAKVTVNGEYLGIYSHVESIKSPFLKARFGNDSGDLYEGTVADLLPDSFQRFEVKTAGSTLNPLMELATLLDQETLDLAAIDKVLDLQAFIRFWATESLLGFWDGYTNNQNNFFVYRNPANSKLYFMPWGLDSALTNWMPLPPFFIRIKSVHCQSLLANRLYREPTIQQRYRDTLESLLENHWDEAKWNREIDWLEARLQNDLHSSQRDFAKRLMSVRKFVAGRRAVLQKELDRWPVRLSKGPREPVYFKSMGEAIATFSTRWTQKKPKNPFASGEVQIQFSLDGKDVPFKEQELGVYTELAEKDKAATLVIIGKRAPDGKQLMLAVELPSSEFQPTGDLRTVVQGYYIEGNAEGLLALFLKPRIQALAGFAHFEQASMHPGAPVRGKLQLQVLQMKGGQARKPKP